MLNVITTYSYKSSEHYSILYSWLFWRTLKLANWSINVTGEFQFGEYVCAARDPVVHYYARNHVVHYHALCNHVFGGINFGDLVKKIHQFVAKLKSPQKFPAIWYIPQYIEYNCRDVTQGCFTSCSGYCPSACQQDGVWIGYRLRPKCCCCSFWKTVLQTLFQVL